jgi:hypothetical protein
MPKATIRTALLLALALGAAACGGGSAPATPRVPAQTSAPEFGANVVRIPGLAPADIAGSALLAVYPPNANARPNGWVIVRPGDWQQALVAAQFAARPVGAGLLLTNQQFLPTPSEDVLGRLRVSGFPRSGGIQTLLFNNVGRDVLLYLTKLRLRTARILDSDLAGLDLKLVPFRGGFAHAYSDTIVIVSSQAPAYALPAGAWSAYSGDTIAFVTRNGVPAATRALLIQREKLLAAKPAIYIVGPTWVVSSGVQKQLSAYGPVKRVAGPTPIDTAIALARYRDPSTGFGWGLKRGPASVSLLNLANWPGAVAAYDLASTGPMAPLLLTTGAGRLPAADVAYLRSLRGRTANQGYVLGDTASISSAALHELDGLLATR